jgi:hypothetical protein
MMLSLEDKAPPEAVTFFDLLTDRNRLPRARSTTAGRLKASLDRLAALAETP